MTQPLLIGLVGKKNSGKTTVTEYLQSKYRFEEVVFADPLKQVVEIIFGFDYDMLLGNTPEKRVLRNTLRDPIWNMTPVQAMQQLGTEVFRDNFDKETWVKIAGRKVDNFLSQGKSVVVSDVRFGNEIEFIRQKGGQIIVLYENAQDTKILTEEELERIKGTPEGHASETSFQAHIDYNKDILIRNEKTGLDDLHGKIEICYHRLTE
jgi:hypothetical protein